MESFGTRLQALRKARGYTQDSIAEKLNVSPQAVSKWENDLTSPDMDTLARLADIFSITVSYVRVPHWIHFGSNVEPPCLRGQTQLVRVNFQFAVFSVG